VAQHPAQEIEQLKRLHFTWNRKALPVAFGSNALLGTIDSAKVESLLCIADNQERHAPRWATTGAHYFNPFANAAGPLDVRKV